MGCLAFIFALLLPFFHIILYSKERILIWYCCIKERESELIWFYFNFHFISASGISHFYWLQRLSFIFVYLLMQSSFIGWPLWKYYVCIVTCYPAYFFYFQTKRITYLLYSELRKFSLSLLIEIYLKYITVKLQTRHF